MADTWGSATNGWIEIAETVISLFIAYYLEIIWRLFSIWDPGGQMLHV
jgi:hypothetical protein